MNANIVRMRNDILPVYRKGEYSQPAIYAKNQGILTIRPKQMFWKSTTDDSSLLVQLDTIIDRKKSYNHKKDTEMLLVMTKDNPRGYIFSFAGGICSLFRK